MEENMPTDIVTLVDDEGVEIEFEVLDCIVAEDSKRKFYALMPNFELEDTNLNDEEVTYFIFEMIEEDGEEQLVEVEDDDLLDELSGQFEERLTDH